MPHDRMSLLLVATILTGCNEFSSPSQKNEPFGTESVMVAEGFYPEVENASGPMDDVGLYRWSSGLQMGTFWAAVGNKSQDYIRFYGESDGATFTINWEPSIELSDTASLAKEGLVNFVVGSKAEVFPYELIDGQPELRFMGMDGVRSKAGLLHMIRNADAPICVEFPLDDVRTCFSQRGAKLALKD